LLLAIDERLKQGRKALEDHFVQNGSPSGWYHHLGKNKRVGISSSAYGLHALSLLSKPSAKLLEVSRQILSDARRFVADSPEGSLMAWPMTHEPSAPLVEPTCYVLQQLGWAGFLRSDAPEAQSAIRWLLGQRQGQAWGPDKSRVYVYVTALVCQVLAQYAPDAPQLAEGLLWLDTAKNDDDGWGEMPADQQSQLWCTAHVILAHVYGRQRSDQGNDVPGARWIRDQCSWMEPYMVQYDFDLPNDKTRSGRAVYRFDPLPIVIHALLECGIQPLAPDLIDAVYKLLEQESDGIWLYPLSTQKTIFNLSHAILALTTFRRRLVSPEIMVGLYDEIQRRGVREQTAHQAPIAAKKTDVRRVLGFLVMFLGFLPCIWLLIGPDSLSAIIHRLHIIRVHPWLPVVSTSLLLLGAMVIFKLKKAIFYAGFAVVVAFALFAFLAAVRGSLLEAAAALIPPVVFLLLKSAWGKVVPPR
jgi:hypothetical protein